jgi:type I restriction enzyme M protein
LPCHLWFYDKGKRKENKDKILMIDARNVFRKVSTTINDFSDDQLEGLTAIMKLYRGEKPTVNKNNVWFNEQFADGKYEDVEGLCKIVSLDEIKDNDYSLTPGRYVGVTFVEDDGVDFMTRLREMQDELHVLNNHASKLAEVISKNLSEIVK